MRKNRWISLAVISLALGLTACGGDDDDDDDDVVNPDAAAGTPDAADTPDADPNQPDAPPLPTCDASALDPQDDGSAAGVFDIVISEISIDGDFVELYNNTGSDIALSSLTTHKWCSRPSYTSVNADGSVVVPAKGYATIPFPTSVPTNGGGDLVLYLDSAYANTSSVLDYVCWGTGGDATRKATAETAGKWSGGCAPAIPSGGSLVRGVTTAGDSATDYTTAGTPTPETCTTD